MSRHITPILVIRRNSAAHHMLNTLAAMPHQQATAGQLKGAIRTHHDAAGIEHLAQQLACGLGVVEVEHGVITLTATGRDLQAQLAGPYKPAKTPPAAARQDVVPPRTWHNVMTGTAPPDRPPVMRAGALDFKSCPSRSGNRFTTPA